MSLPILHQYQALAEPVATDAELTQIDKWLGFGDVPALPRIPIHWMQWIAGPEQTTGEEILLDNFEPRAEIPVLPRKPVEPGIFAFNFTEEFFNPTPVDWRLDTERPPAGKAHPNVGGSFHLIEESFFPVNLDWYRETERPILGAPPAMEGDVSSPWLSSPAFEPHILDWIATPPDPTRRVPVTHEGYSVWHITDFIAALDWLRDAEKPVFNVKPLADYGGFGLPGDPLNPELTPFPHIEATVIYPAPAALPTEPGDVFTHSLVLDAIEWMTAIEQPFAGPPRRWSDYFATSQDLTLDLSLTWLQSANEPRWNTSPRPVTDFAYIGEMANVGDGGLGWQQPMVEQQWPARVPLTYSFPTLALDTSIETESVLEVDNQNVDGR